jgi:cyclic pyranopterin phosphate synthase
MAELTHWDEEGKAKMVDVGDKEATPRQAMARGRVKLASETVARVRAKRLKKGDLLEVARIAGIMAAKRCAELIPLCHPLPLTHVDVSTEIVDDGVEIGASVRTVAPTGVEMEAMTAVSVAALTVYDMCKAVERGIVIGDIHLVRKEGGRSGVYDREE